MRRHCVLAPTKTADGQQRAAHRREGDGTPRRVPGSDQPQSSHVLYGTSGGSYPSGAYAFRRSRGQKDHLRTPFGGLPEVLRPARSPVRQRSGWWSPKSDDQEDGGRLGYPKRSRRPRERERAEWTMVSRYGHFRSAPVVVDVGLRTEWEPPTLRAALCVSTRRSWRLLDGLFPLQTCNGVRGAVPTTLHCRLQEGDG